MKKLFVSALAMLAVALGFTACSSEDEFVNETPAQGQKVTVIASTEQPSAQRTALGTQGEDGTYPVFWLADDEITIGGKEFELKEGATTSTGTFVLKADEEKPAAGTEVIAYYPSTYDGTWPAAQTYVANNIPLGVPMKATGITVDESGNISPISFKNEGGILCLNLKMDEGTKSISKVVVSSKTGLTENIELNCMTAAEVGTTSVPFNIAVPAAAYSDLKIVIFDENGKVCRLTLKSDKTVTVQRSMITDINLTLAPGNFFDYIELAGLKWATVNVGAVNNITPKTTDATYGYYYSQSDAITAAESLGGTWKLPTEEQWEALKNNCNWEWENSYSFGGKTMDGCKVSDKNDPSKFIFLPAAGIYYDGGSNVRYRGYDGDYWSTGYGRYLDFYDGNRGMSSIGPDNGMTVRPVSE